MKFNQNQFKSNLLNKINHKLWNLKLTANKFFNNFLMQKLSHDGINFNLNTIEISENKLFSAKYKILYLYCPYENLKKHQHCPHYH